MSWTYSCLAYIKAVFKIKNKTLLTSDSQVVNFHYFKEVFILSLVPINLHDIFESIQEVVERGLVLQDEHFGDTIDCSTFMWQVSCELVHSGNFFLNDMHFFTQLCPTFLALQNAIDDAISSCFVFD